MEVMMIDKLKKMFVA